MALQDKVREALRVAPWREESQSWGSRLVAHIPGCTRVALIGGVTALGAVLAAFVILVGAFLLVFRFINPPATPLMVWQALNGKEIEQRWVSLDQISPNLIRAVISSEDGQFCYHYGVDLREMQAVLRQAEQNGLSDARGASTITMQVAKNLFLWPSRDLFRKGLELGIAVLMEQIWPKRRILEVYLNIAEWGPGVFGAEAAARHHFHKPAAKLTARESALLAASLPNPHQRVASTPGPGMRRVAQIVQARARQGSERFACVLPARQAR
ncbi:MAG: monofunctional biosynthetic peptidoglycan transglycosylase [Proteobacteria bacterium]|jgi:monofunctional biosynthetic peptidoglycan transglycosylase|nr:MAG: monofunctional biosynthetic peptidoglycan transglycosylase [Pseudomonadota bacterium]